MKIKHLLKGMVLASALISTFAFAESTFNVGVVDFEACISKSRLGQQEIEKLESLQNEMRTVFDEKQMDYQKVAEKLNNADYMETVTADAEKELESQARALSEELQLINSQSSQALQQASAKTMQSLKAEIDKVCEYIAREKDYDYILSKESCFYFKRPNDVTQLVIHEMDRHYEPEATPSEN